MAIVLDADGLIKLTKAGVIKEAAKEFACTISKEVFGEVVSEGRRRLYEDAFIVEDLVKEGKITVRSAGKFEMQERLGIGESSTLKLAKSTNAVVVSDDRAFLSVLESGGIEFITPPDFIWLLYRRGAIGKDAALNALSLIEKIIRKENYESARKMIEGG